MSAAIHTRYGNRSGAGYVRAWTKDGKRDMALRLPYPHELHHSRRHPAAAQALATRLGWAGLWIVGHNDDGSICAVQASGAAGVEMLEAQQSRYSRDHGIEGEDWFFVGEKSR
jgi:hypothetical protein